MEYEVGSNTSGGLFCYPLGFHLFINHNQKLPAYERKILAYDPRWTSREKEEGGPLYAFTRKPFLADSYTHLSRTHRLANNYQTAREVAFRPLLFYLTVVA